MSSFYDDEGGLYIDGDGNESRIGGEIRKGMPWKWIIGFGLALSAVVVLGCFTMFIFWSGDDAPAYVPPSNAREVSFSLGPYFVPRGSYNESDHVAELPQQLADLSEFVIHRVSVDFLDEYGRVVPLEHVYVHHTFLAFVDAPGEWDTFSLVMGFGAEGTNTPVEMPADYAIVVRGRKTWLHAVHLLDVIGGPGTYDQNIYVRYNVTYSDDAERLQEVACGIVGIQEHSAISQNDNPEFEVPGNGGLESVIDFRQDFVWPVESAKVVYSAGHLHIGSRRIVAYPYGDTDAAKSNPLLVSYPHYDNIGYVVATDWYHPSSSHLKQGGKYTIEVTYDNSRRYQAVMGLFQICTAFADNADPFETWRRISNTNSSRSISSARDVHALFN
eukprot:CAMPEP_0119131950 /NCGR_PEP_ID=MMETSP1310-20130426/10987_1 /TAXON_ID=464262 /ORGANISM="Genus nov. species nov., Strain RCC2339" /LENGTH=385 /DNA_ID=CAMNT_0007122551 /DNA_START=112 /DNA_END=1269 /DNA_ORIENTATION=+